MKPQKDYPMINYIKLKWEQWNLYIVVIISSMVISMFIYSSRNQYKLKAGDVVILGENGCIKLATNEQIDKLQSNIIIDDIDSGYVTMIGTVGNINTRSLYNTKTYQQIVKEREYQNYESLVRCYNNTGAKIRNGTFVEYVRSDKDCPGIKICKAVDFTFPKDPFEEIDTKYGIVTTDVDANCYVIVRVIKLRNYE